MSSETFLTRNAWSSTPGLTRVPLPRRELWWQRCGRFLEVRNRPRADPVGGLGGGDRDAMATLDARCWAG
jgi:hypothetical protein